MTSPLDQAPLIATWLAATDIDTLELIGPDGRILLRQGAARDETSEVAPPEPAVEEARSARVTVASPGIGLFRRAHPLREEKLAEEGEAVAAGHILALLQVGALLVPVPAPHAGIVAAVLGVEGALNGFGDPLFELWPHEEES